MSMKAECCGVLKSSEEHNQSGTLLELAMKWKDSQKQMASEEDCEVGRRPLEERWPPLGAPSTELAQETNSPRSETEIRELETEHEKLNSSLLALTTHFAQVQFRLKQVVAAPKSDQEVLLQSLEKFAFEGIPDVDGAKPVSKNKAKMHVQSYQKKIDDQKKKQAKLIGQLKEQLQEMEEAVIKGVSKNDDTPQNLIEKQKLLLAQLSIQDKKHTSCHENEQLNDQVPKEKVIKQITKQIIDLEKFIKLLQGETGLSPKKCCKCSNCSCEDCGVPHSSKHLTTKEKKNKAGLHSALKKSPLLNKRKADHSKRVVEEEQWDEGLGVHYTVENFGLIEDDSGSDVPCCILPKHSSHVTSRGHHYEKLEETPDESNQRIKEASLEIIKRALAILQIFAVSQFGCAGQHLQDQLIKRAMQTPVPPYENLIRSLRKSIENVQSHQARVLEEIGIHSPGINHATLSRTSRSGSISSLVSTISSVGDGSGEFTTVEAELIRSIRREFSTCLRDLFEHGLEKNADYHVISAKSFVTCLIPSSTPRRRPRMHAWDVFMAYYNVKNGREYNLAVPRKLSESFGIDVTGASAVTTKQTLLRTIHFVKSTHERCKRSKESMFRALVSAGLNQKKLSSWCRQIVKCSSLIDENYQNWSCVVRTGFEEVLDILEILTPLDFCLPEDLAIRHLTRANDAFGESY